MWLLHPEFPNLVQNAWGQDAPLSSTIPNFTNRANQWNREVFGNLFDKKRKVLARLNGVQKALANHPNNFLIQLEKQLIEEYSLVRLQEEEYWALKSRLNWAAFGDRNTSFFHVSTLVRRNRNKIRCIKKTLEEWISNEEQIKNLIQNNFLTIFTTGLIQGLRTSEVAQFLCTFLSEEEKAKLIEDVTYDEIKARLWSLKAFKAPGVDGLHAGFFQIFWHEVSESICKEVGSIFSLRVMPDYLNRTLIALVPNC